ncbi:MAG: hypothetical protein ACTHZX_04175 [Microbacterium sp.]
MGSATHAERPIPYLGVHWSRRTSDQFVKVGGSGIISHGWAANEEDEMTFFEMNPLVPTVWEVTFLSVGGIIVAALLVWLGYWLGRRSQRGRNNRHTD